MSPVFAKMVLDTAVHWSQGEEEKQVIRNEISLICWYYKGEMKTNAIGKA